jgi:hypothetical protein
LECQKALVFFHDPRVVVEIHQRSLAGDIGVGFESDSYGDHFIDFQDLDFLGLFFELNLILERPLVVREHSDRVL